MRVYGRGKAGPKSKVQIPVSNPKRGTRKTGSNLIESISGIPEPLFSLQRGHRVKWLIDARRSGFSLIESFSGKPELPPFLWKSTPLQRGQKGVKSSAADRISGFSLIEIVVAMGILTFALVGLLALFPVALETAAESKAETRVTQIAQSVFADLKASSLSASVMIVGSDAQQSGNRQTVNFSTAQTYYLGYNGDGTCVGALTSTNYSTGVTGKGEFILKLTSVPVTPATIPAVSTITLSVESPAGAPLANRQKYVFVTMKGDL